MRQIKEKNSEVQRARHNNFGTASVRRQQSEYDENEQCTPHTVSWTPLGPKNTPWQQMSARVIHMDMLLLVIHRRLPKSSFLMLQDFLVLHRGWC